MVRQYDAQHMCDIELRRFGLWDKGWRTSFSKAITIVGQCNDLEKRIIISVPHLASRSDAELKDTILHEIAHALVGCHNGHNQVWKDKAIELGAKPYPCTQTNLDLGRSITEVERKPAEKIKSLQNFCPVCHEVAITKSQVNKKSKVTGKVQTWLKLECGHVIVKDRLIDSLAGLSKWTSRSGKRIFPYQVEGIKAIGKANGRILIADEPGLGKTAQAIGALYYYKEMRPALWVCKVNLGLQSLKETLDWSDLKMMGQIIHHGKMFIIPGMDVYIISMDLLRNMPTEKLDELMSICNTVVADEVQHFKDPDAGRTQELKKLVAKSKFFIAMSGTPWKNRGSEYFSVLNMLRSDLFPSLKHFKNRWIEDYYDRQSGKTREGGIKNIPAFRELTKDFVIRRMRDDVLPDLPKINRQVRFVDMDEEYAKAYDKQESKVATMIKAALIDGTSMKGIAAMIMTLKHNTGLAKVKTCIDDVVTWLEDVPEDYEKLTIFHHHIDVGDHLENGVFKEFDGINQWLVNNGYNRALRLKGGMHIDTRNKIMADFEKDPKNRVLIASSLASGEGLNIQFCQNAYFLERQWNPQNEEQCELRFSRPITRTQLPPYLYPIADRKISITVPYFIAADTIDEMLTNIVERKRLNFRKSMNEKDINLTWDENEIIKELAGMIIKKRFKKTLKQAESDEIEARLEKAEKDIIEARDSNKEEEINELNKMMGDNNV